uniref:Uncharacterized protein n=1 Tax=Micrurus carvalhoi TaxID=3147026 RepID=A0A2H6N0J7_9SAUR
MDSARIAKCSNGFSFQNPTTNPRTWILVTSCSFYAEQKPVLQLKKKLEFISHDNKFRKVFNTLKRFMLKFRLVSEMGNLLIQILTANMVCRLSRQTAEYGLQSFLKGEIPGLRPKK